MKTTAKYVWMKRKKEIYEWYIHYYINRFKISAILHFVYEYTNALIKEYSLPMDEKLEIGLTLDKGDKLTESDLIGREGSIQMNFNFMILMSGANKSKMK